MRLEETAEILGIFILQCLDHGKENSESGPVSLVEETGSEYPVNRVSFDLPRLVGKRKELVPTSSTIHIEHAPNSNFSTTSIKPLP